VPTEFDRRGLLRAGGLLSLAAVLDACSSGSSGTTAASTTPASASGTRSASSAPTPAPTTAAAPAIPSAAALLRNDRACTLTHATIAGPTWFDAHDVRSDIRDGRPGVPLELAFRVVRLPSCAPLPNAVVDLWQCDALGVYSGFAHAAPGNGGRPGGRDRYGDKESAATDADRWLRGTQVSGPDGVVTFRTIYPGWYPTRTAHLHLKVHLSEKTVLTTQLFFDDAVSDRVYRGSDPYRQHPGRDTRNPTDPFYSPSALMTTKAAGDGWLAALTLGVP
jgi:protocatechuate 3,4-dioxygenase beta subunit